MDKYKYYTPKELARSLIQLLPNHNYARVIDICCGSWNLLHAAKEFYPNAELTGVDIDKCAREFTLEDSRFFNVDGRLFALQEYENRSTYDLILSNPPFGYLKDEERVFTHGCTEIYYAGLLNKRYENEMTQANFLLSHNNSVHLFILPSTFVEGTSNIKARRDISKKYSILSLILLPKETFGSSKINTYAIIMNKGANQNTTTNIFEANNYSEKWSINKVCEVPYAEVINGNWSSNCINNLEDNDYFDIYRGNIGSGDFSDNGIEVLHCSNKIEKAIWKPSVRYYNENKLGKVCKKAKEGDVLINRIGVKAGYWSINKYNNIAISDCIIVISPKNSDTIKLIERFSTDGRLNVSLRGVATKFINMCDVQQLLSKD